MWKSRINLGWTLGRWVLHLLKSWWRNDRIRVSPREGRLLRLHPRCHLLIRGLPVQVLKRKSQPHASDGPAVLVYFCWTPSGPGELLVVPGECLTALRIIWRHQGCVEDVLEADIEIYA